jgi:hypothetical protein
MIAIQVVPAAGLDAYRMLRARVSGDATTWYWANKRKTRLRHVRSEGWVDVHAADGVLVARVHPKKTSDLFYLAEKLMGRLVAWFEDDLAAINLQFVAAPPPRRKRR